MAAPSARLLVTTGPRKGEVIVLPAGEATLGRDSGCAVVIDDLSVSRRHVAARLTTAGLSLNDLGSKNGIEVDGRSVREALLRPGASFKIGKVELQWLEEAPPLPVSVRAAPQVAVEPVDATILGAEDAPPENVVEVVAGRPGRLRGILTLAVFVMLIVFALAVLWSVFKPLPPAPKISFMKEGREQLLDLRDELGLRHGAGRNRLPAKLVVLKGGESLRVRFDHFDGADCLWMLYAKALGQGEALVRLDNAAGDELLRVKFVMKGRDENAAETENAKELPEAGRKRRAEEDCARAAALLKEDPYLAARYYREAAELLGTLQVRPELYFTASTGLKEADDLLKKRLEEAWARYRAARKNEQHDTALDELKNIEALIRDPQSIDVQRARVFRGLLLDKIAALQKK